MAEETTTTTTETTQENVGESGGTEKLIPQSQVNTVVSIEKKKAETSARNALLKELGFNPDDPKVIEALKGKLTVAEQAEAAQKAAEDAKKDELQKMQERLTAVEKERDDEKAARSNGEVKRLADKLDGKLQTLATAERALPEAVDDVVTWLRKNKGEAVDALMDKDEKFNEAEAKKLLEEVRKAKAHYFQGARGAGSGSHSVGTTPGTDDKEARDKHFKEYRRS